MGRSRGALLCAAAFLAAACATPDATEEVEFRVPVTVEPVALGDVEDLITATGTLRAPESAVLTVETAGFLSIARNAAGRPLAEGDRVKAGQRIAEVAGVDVRLAAGAEAARQRFESMQQVLASRRKLFDLGLISEEELRQAETNLAEAKLAWERSQLTEERTQIVTPIAGVILRLARDNAGLPVAEGQRVAVGFAVAQIAPLATLIADVDLAGPDVARIRVGLPARLRHYAWQGETFAGHVVRLAPTLDPVRRTVRAEVAVDNPDERLRPGMFVEVTLVAERREGVPVVPREAVTERGGQRVVFVLDGQRVAKRQVVLGLGDDTVVEVRQGVEPEERVVVRGLETLADGTRVRVSKG